eukprot:6194256-Pleurochrysis_carterae.AAC.4
MPKTRHASRRVTTGASAADSGAEAEISAALSSLSAFDAFPLYASCKVNGIDWLKLVLGRTRLAKRMQFRLFLAKAKG